MAIERRAFKDSDGADSNEHQVRPKIVRLPGNSRGRSRDRIVEGRRVEVNAELLDFMRAALGNVGKSRT